jgi:hypothetical protein
MAKSLLEAKMANSLQPSKAQSRRESMVMDGVGGITPQNAQQNGTAEPQQQILADGDVQKLEEKLQDSLQVFFSFS